MKIKVRLNKIKELKKYRRKIERELDIICDRYLARIERVDKSLFRLLVR